MALTAKFDRQHARQRLAFGVHTPFLRVALDGGAQAEGGEFVLERLGIVQRHAFGDCCAVTRAIQETEDAIAQVLGSAVKNNLAAVAGLVEAVHRREHGTDVELPLWKKL